MSFKSFLKGLFIILIILILLMGLCDAINRIHPGKTTYQKIQEYRHENYYDIIDYDNYLPDYDGNYESFTEQDVINAYKYGVNDGIKQTIEYFEYNED